VRRPNLGQDGRRNTFSNPHYRDRFPAEIISHAVWLYHVVSLSFRDVELILAERGVLVPSETVRRWSWKFGQSFAQGQRWRRPQPGDKWHLDKVFIRIHGELHYLWRAVDQDGVVLDVLVQRRRNGKAAKRRSAGPRALKRLGAAATVTIESVPRQLALKDQPPLFPWQAAVCEKI